MSVWRRFDHGFPSLVTTNVRVRRPVFGDAAAARHVVKVIQEIAEQEPFELLAFVVMPDHLHLVAWPRPPVTTARLMKMIKGRFAREYQATRGQRGPFWQERYHEEALTTDDAVLRAVEYVHHNPVEAGLVKRPADWPWSSASPAPPLLSGWKPDPRDQGPTLSGWEPDPRGQGMALEQQPIIDP